MNELAALERLVRCYSPSGHEQRAVREFVRLARSLGYAAHVDAAGNGIAVRGTGRPRVTFLGHIDTVDGQLPVRRTSNSLCGRGVVDAKGALVAALLAGQQDPGPGELRVVAAVGEETDSRGARHLVARSRADLLLVGEPSGWDGVTVGYKGEIKLVATFRTRRSHHSSPFPTASDLALDWVGRLRADVESRRKESAFHSLSLKVVGLESHDADGREVSRLTVDLRLPPGLSTGELLSALPREPTRPSLALLVRVEPVEVDRRNPVVESLIDGIRAHGARPVLWRKGGTSDLNLAAAGWGVPAAAYGPGNARLDHTDHERVSRAELARSVAVLAHAFSRLRSAAPTPRRSAGGVSGNRRAGAPASPR